MKKVIIFLVISTLVFTGCASGLGHNEVYNDNERIAQPGDSYAYLTKVSNQDGSLYEVSATMQGSQTIWEYDAAAGDVLDVSYQLSASKGKIKLVLISPDGELVTIVENAGRSKQSEFVVHSYELEEGHYRIKLVGADRAKFELKLDIEMGNFDLSES